MKARFRRLIARLLQRQVVRLIARYDLTVVAVAGSVGKTSTKSAIATTLAAKYQGQVLAHPGNYNSEISLPLSIFELPVPKRLMNPASWVSTLRRMRAIISNGNYPYKYLVLELGIDHPGEMADFLTYLHPNLGVVTAIAPEHMEYFKTLDIVADEEFKLALGSKTAVLNADDDRLRELAATLDSDPLMVGDRGQVKFVETFATDLAGLGGTLHLPDNQTVEVQTHVLAEHGLYALYFAAAVAHRLGLSPAEIKAGLEAFRPVAGRMNPLIGLHDTLIIDDTYNSSPDAVLAALASLAKLEGRHIAILGSMNELGDTSEEAHRLVGGACGALDLLVTIGADANSWMVPAAVEAGLDEGQIHSFNSPFEAGRFVAAQLKTGDVVLAKGSQNRVFAEEAVKQLLKDPADAAKLVRQSRDWMRTKSEQFE